MAKKLAELEPHFLVRDGNRAMEIDDLTRAQGIRFLCPRCWERNEGPVGTHWIVIWFAGRGVPESAQPGPCRWNASGTGYDDLTLAPSIDLSGTCECRWHGHIVNGEVR